MENHDIHEQICFAKISTEEKGCIAYYLIYSNSITVENSGKLAYRHRYTDKVFDIYLLVRDLIKKTYMEATELPWPLKADDLGSNNFLSDELVRFLTLVISGISDAGKMGGNTARFVLSISQDVCRATTDGEWKLPKHILLSHLFQGKQLIIILNQLGHSEGYDFSLEIETSMAKAIDEISSYLTTQVVTGEGNVIFHCQWDNLNKILTNVQ